MSAAPRRRREAVQIPNDCSETEKNLRRIFNDGPTISSHETDPKILISSDNTRLDRWFAWYPIRYNGAGWNWKSGLIWLRRVIRIRYPHKTEYWPVKRWDEIQRPNYHSRFI